MRRLALLLAIWAAFAAWGERVPDSEVAHNFLANGGFDDPGFKQTALQGYDGRDQAWECKSLPGWEISTVNRANGIVEVLPHDEPGDNPQYVRFYHYTDGCWAPITLSATAKGLQPGREYVLDMYVCHRYIDSNSWANPDHGFRIFDASGQQICSQSSLSEGEEWEYVIFTFVPEYEEITLQLWSQNNNGEGHKSGQHTVCWDQVRIYDPTDSGIPTLSADAPAQLYTLQGIPVNGCPSPGLYISKHGSQTTKILIK